MICPRCRQPYDDWAYHISHDPPAGCPVYALAFGDYWPFSDYYESRRLAVDPAGQRLCRCGAVAVCRHECRECFNARMRRQRAARARRKRSGALANG